MKTIKVNIVTPDGPVYDSEVNMIIASTTTGEIGVLPGHIPMVAPLKVGAIRLKKEGTTEIVAVSGGFLEVRPDQVSILAPSAEVASTIDINRAKEAMKRAEERLNLSKQDDVDFKRAELSLKRAMNRINVNEGNI
ncbi:F0F1 ATP synthase subunit epsilon [Paenisporosarcina sp. FSL H8-0542]|uniref:F0F1 ATP synthase subunit epsilon n=1 Tax=unclassified Paenisporosarcina TaxID=2642018 RepID=UPI00034E920A|nr:F0F1 ATP synthase subunit epsilon [Paenisporosarcina sp. HGH0030]EPD51630.1 ATP synthase F1, epsilon subunit [Paenisporosarcina sp. HGH0030]